MNKHDARKTTEHFLDYGNDQGARGVRVRIANTQASQDGTTGKQASNRAAESLEGVIELIAEVIAANSMRISCRQEDIQQGASIVTNGLRWILSSLCHHY